MFTINLRIFSFIFAGALIEAGCGESEHQVSTDKVSTIDDGSSGEEISEPEMISGSFLTSCYWVEKGVSLSCQMLSVDPEIKITDSKELPEVQIFDGDGRLTDSSGWTAEFSVDSERSLSILIQLGSKDLNAQVQIKGKKDSEDIIHAVVTSDQIEASAPVVRLFAQKQFQGSAVSLALGEFDRDKDFSDLDGRLSSVKIPSGYGVRACDGGTCIDLYGDTKSLEVLNNRVQKIVVYKSDPFATIFQHFGWKGRTQTISTGLLTFEFLTIKNAVSAFHIPDGFILKACKDEAGTESCVEYTEDQYSLPGMHNDKFKSFIFSKKES